MKVAPPRLHHPVKDSRTFSIQNIGQWRDDLMPSRCLAVCNVVKDIPEPLKAHFANHGFGHRPGCSGDFNIEGVYRKQHGTRRHRCGHASVESIRIAPGNNVRDRLKAHRGRPKRDTQTPRR